MKVMSTLLATLAGSALIASVAFANPGMLPKHPGYPAKGKSPVTGQATANDQGQSNMVYKDHAAMSGDASSMNKVSDPNRMRIKMSRGAGRLPEVDGAVNEADINPPVKEATRMK